ncbi:MAG: hypothetical protein ACREVZ_00310 [Burkholderiales bacterium]
MIVRTLDSRGRMCVLNLEDVSFAVRDTRSLRDSQRRDIVAEERSVRVHLRGIAQPIWLHADAWPLFEKLAEADRLAVTNAVASK